MSIRFAVIGDTHYVTPESHQKAFAGQTTSVTELIDLQRNHPLSASVLPRVISDVNAAAPHLVIQTGDIIQGHCDDQAGCLREMREALDLLAGLQAPLYFALGTHDGVLGQRDDAPIRELVLPHIGELLGRTLAETYYSFAVERTLFIILDYATYVRGDDQCRFLARELQRGSTFEHVFLLGHPPLIPVGRLGFAHFDLCEDVLKLVAQYPVDAYFCGHTHNQVASVHRVGDGWLAHLKGTILGYADEPAVPLTAVRPLLPDPDTYEYGWGFIEDSAPGWWLVTVAGDVTTIEWRRVGGGVSGVLETRKGEQPRFLQRPAEGLAAPEPLPPLAAINAVRIRVAGSGCRTAGLYTIALNGQSLGELPWLEYFDCRRWFEMPSGQWPLLAQDNYVTITTGDEPMCIGAVVIEIATATGTVRSTVSDYFANTAKWDRWRATPLHHIAPGATVTCSLTFSRGQGGIAGGCR
jgi:hypothetical protein